MDFTEKDAAQDRAIDKLAKQIAAVSIRMGEVEAALRRLADKPTPTQCWPQPKKSLLERIFMRFPIP